MGKLSTEEIKKRLSRLSGWNVRDDVLEKEFKFKNFAAAMEFMNRLAATAERLNHHPDWSNSYNKVIIRLTTHSEDSLSDKDFEFAESADSVGAEIQ